MPRDRIVLAYSGSLETSVAIPWLTERYEAEIIALTLDVGQGREVADLRERALAAGAARAHVLDVRDEFARHYVVPALQAGAVDGDLPLARALSRPLVAMYLVKVARMEGAAIIAHGGTGEDGGPARVEVAAQALDPKIQVLAPARTWKMTRPDLLEYARRRHVPGPAATAIPFRVEGNLWGRSIEGGRPGDSSEPPEDVYILTRPPGECPDGPAYVEIEFVEGVPVSINGVEMGLTELISSLDTIAGAHGVGRLGPGRVRQVSATSWERFEAPAAEVLYLAHCALRASTAPAELERVRQPLGEIYADLIHQGRWFSPTREAIDALVSVIERRVTGHVRLALQKGSCTVVGCRSPFACRDHDFATSVAHGAVVHGSAGGAS